MAEFIFQIATVALMVVGAWVIMALGVYLIGILFFQLPFFFWARPKPPATSGIAAPSEVCRESEAGRIAA